MNPSLLDHALHAFDQWRDVLGGFFSISKFSHSHEMPKVRLDEYFPSSFCDSYPACHTITDLYE